MDVQSLFREYLELERRRTREGITPVEYQRWSDLLERLNKRLSAGSPGGIERRGSVRTPTRMVAEFRTPRHLRRAIIRNLSGTGVFISTPFPPDIGTELIVRVRIQSTGRIVDFPGVVVSCHVGDGFDTSEPGMGVRFHALDAQQARALDQLRAISVEEGEDDTESTF